MSNLVNFNRVDHFVASIEAALKLAKEGRTKREAAKVEFVDCEIRLKEALKRLQK